MNLLWIAALTVLVATEKRAPKGDMIAKVLGVLMIGAGVARLAFLPR
jgi:predicted metal-binding membrane protein